MVAVPLMTWSRLAPPPGGVDGAAGAASSPSPSDELERDLRSGELVLVHVSREPAAGADPTSGGGALTFFEENMSAIAR